MYGISTSTFTVRYDMHWDIAVRVHRIIQLQLFFSCIYCMLKDLHKERCFTKVQAYLAYVYYYYRIMRLRTIDLYEMHTYKNLYSLGAVVKPRNIRYL
jgi:hypothetical protein